MRKLLFISALASCIALAGCQTASDTAVEIASATKTVSEKVKSVQGYAVQLCGYLPIAATVTSIFNSGFGSSVSVVGSAICDAVTNRPLADGPGNRVPKVGKVVVRGKFVR